MYLMYVDESGDTGRDKSPTRYFILSAIFVHESSWTPLLKDLNIFRKHLKNKYGLLKREEIHASVFSTGRCVLKNDITHANRINILLQNQEI